jgi:transposase
METFTMSRKEAPRPGLVKAALAGQISNRQGAQALGITVRHFQRLKQRLRAEGLRGLVPQGRGRPSSRRAERLRQQVGQLLQTTYLGFNDCHLTEKLQEREGLSVSREFVRRVRVALGLAARRPRRPPPHRQRRAREAAVGELVQIDGSPFAWLEARGPDLTLLGAIDDATSQILALTFRPHEDLHGYTVRLRQVLTSHGVPVALYGDGLNVFVRNDRHWSLDEQLRGAQEPTHFGRMLQELGIGFVQARSPQGKGRVERLWGTRQDRLVSALRLRGIDTLEAANAFLPAFIADHNRRFAQPPAAPRAVWRPCPPQAALLLSCRYRRTVARDNTVRLGARWVQLPRGPQRRSYAGRRVEVRELLDGRLVVLADSVQLASAEAPGGEFVLKPRRAPGVDHRAPRPLPRLPRFPRTLPRLTAPTHTGRRPLATHPWMQGYDPPRMLAKRPSRADRG